MSDSFNTNWASGQQRNSWHQGLNDLGFQQSTPQFSENKLDQKTINSHCASHSSPYIPTKMNYGPNSSNCSFRGNQESNVHCQETSGSKFHCNEDSVTSSRAPPSFGQTSLFSIPPPLSYSIPPPLRSNESGPLPPFPLNRNVPPPPFPLNRSVPLSQSASPRPSFPNLAIPFPSSTSDLPSRPNPIPPYANLSGPPPCFLPSKSSPHASFPGNYSDHQTPIPQNHYAHSFPPPRYSANTTPQNHSGSNSSLPFPSIFSRPLPVTHSFGVQNQNGASIDCSRMTETFSSNVTRNVNLEFISNWQKNIESRLSTEDQAGNYSTKIKISDIQKKLLQYALLARELDKLLEQLSNTDLNDQEWKNLFKKSEHVKSELVKLKQFFSNPKCIENVQESLKQRREKRVRLKKTKQNRIKRRKTMLEDRKKKENMIDKLICQLQDEEKSKISEAKMRREADAILRGVRTKQEEALKMQKLVKAVALLREIRIKKGETHGYVECHRANAFFEKFKDEFDKIAEDQLSLYRSEELTLKVMMEESKPRQQQSLLAKRLKNEFSDKDRVKKQIYAVLFGGDEVLPKDLNEYQRSFVSAEESVEILVKRRSDWDKFIAIEKTSEASSIPLNWVVPPTEPNQDWKPFQK